MCVLVLAIEHGSFIRITFAWYITVGWYLRALHEDRGKLELSAVVTSLAVRLNAPGPYTCTGSIPVQIGFENVFSSQLEMSYYYVL